MVDSMTSVVFRAGDVVVKTGDLATRMIIVDVGTVNFVEERRVEGKKKADRVVQEIAVRCVSLPSSGCCSSPLGFSC